MITKLDFIAVPSRDAERSRSFYMEFWVGETCFGIWEPETFGIERCVTPPRSPGSRAKLHRSTGRGVGTFGSRPHMAFVRGFRAVGLSIRIAHIPAKLPVRGWRSARPVGRFDRFAVLTKPSRRGERILT